MSNIDRELITSVEQFYYREARLLDARQYEQWLGLVTEDIEYLMPNRHTPFADLSKRETEAFLSVEQELSHGNETPLREEDYLNLSIRVMRAFKSNSWTDNPPPKTRRFITNVEVVSMGDGKELSAYSNILLYYSRYGSDHELYSAQRADTLRLADDQLKISRRKIVIDDSVIAGPSVGLFF